jgi:integrase
MPRSRSDGSPPRPPNKQKLTEFYVRRSTQPGLTWDTLQKGLALKIHPSGSKSYKVVYSRSNRVRWYHLADANAIALSDARELARRVMYEVAEGKDPQAERRAARGAGNFEQLATRYLEEHARKHNRSWRQADKLVRRHLLPIWGKLLPSDITRSDVKQMMTRITSPTVANQTLASASAIFSWALKAEVNGIKSNPCSQVERHETTSRERVLKDHELPRFWNAFGQYGRAGVALKLILLTGQRPGEVTHLRLEHIHDGWWELPGKPELDWPGTKNGESHRVWLPPPARELVPELVNGDRRALSRLAEVMHNICDELGISDRATPHDLRRTHGTKIAALGFDRHAMNRIQNHKDGGIASVYDRHGYAEENKRIMEAVAIQLLTLVGSGICGRIVDTGKIETIDQQWRRHLGKRLTDAK